MQYAFRINNKSVGTPLQPFDSGKMLMFGKEVRLSE